MRFAALRMRAWRHLFPATTNAPFCCAPPPQRHPFPLSTLSLRMPPFALRRRVFHAGLAGGGLDAAAACACAGGVCLANRAWQPKNCLLPAAAWRRWPLSAGVSSFRAVCGTLPGFVLGASLLADLTRCAGAACSFNLYLLLVRFSLSLGGLVLECDMRGQDNTAPAGVKANGEGLVRSRDGHASRAAPALFNAVLAACCGRGRTFPPLCRVSAPAILGLRNDFLCCWFAWCGLPAAFYFFCLSHTVTSLLLRASRILCLPLRTGAFASSTQRCRLSSS